MKIKYLIAFILGGYCNVLIAASELIYEKKEKQSFEITFQSGKSGDPAINNFFIREIAKQNLSGLYSTAFTLHYTSWNTLQRTGNKGLKVQSVIEPQNITGDVYYKEFNISDILMPELASFRIVVFVDGFYLDSREFDNIRIDKKGFSTGFDLESNTEGQNYSVLVEDLIFYSDQEDKSGFLNRIKFIDDYYASVALMEDVLKQQVDQRSAESGSMLLAFVRIFELNRVIREIESSGFSRILNGNQEDIAGYNMKLSELKDEYSRLEAYYQYLLNSGYEIIPDVDLQTSADLYVNLVSRYFSLSENVAHAYGPYYFAMGKVSFNSFMKRSFEDGIAEVLQKSNSSIEPFPFIPQLENKIYEHYLSIAEALINDEQFSTAKGILINARLIHESNNKNDFQLEMNMMISQADYGIYNSYLKVMDRAIEAEVFLMAEIYIDKAWDFQRKNKTSIITDNQLVLLQTQLIEKYLAKGNRLYSENEYEDAIFCFEKARENSKGISIDDYDSQISQGLIDAKNGLYRYLLDEAGRLIEDGNYSQSQKLINQAITLQQQNRAEIIVADHINDIQNNILIKVFNDLIAVGNSSMEIGDFEKAYISYKDANALEIENHFQQDLLAGISQKDAAEKLILMNCENGLYLVNQNSLDEAIKIYDRCILLSNENNLSQSDQIQSSMETLEKGVREKKCQIIRMECKDLFTAAEQLKVASEYALMVQKLDSCLDRSKHNINCDVDESRVYKLLSQYRDLAKYQLLLTETKNALKQDNAEAFLGNYIQMCDLSDRVPMVKKEIEVYPFQNILSDKKYFYQIYNIIQKYDESQDLSAMLELLNALKKNSYSAKETMKIQRIIGRSMSLNDQKNVFNVNPRPLLKQYTNSDNWFRFFENAYMEVW